MVLDLKPYSKYTESISAEFGYDIKWYDITSILFTDAYVIKYNI